MGGLQHAVTLAIGVESLPGVVKAPAVSSTPTRCSRQTQSTRSTGESRNAAVGHGAECGGPGVIGGLCQLLVRSKQSVEREHDQQCGEPEADDGADRVAVFGEEAV